MKLVNFVSKGKSTITEQEKADLFARLAETFGCCKNVSEMTLEDNQDEKILPNVTFRVAFKTPLAGRDMRRGRTYLEGLSVTIYKSTGVLETNNSDGTYTHTPCDMPSFSASLSLKGKTIEYRRRQVECAYVRDCYQYGTEISDIDFSAAADYVRHFLRFAKPAYLMALHAAA